MKKLVAALVVLAMVLAMVPAVFAADQMEITGSVTDKFVGTFTATSDGTLTLTVESVAEGYGYRFDVWNITKEDLADTIVSNEATAQTIALTAGNEYEITVEYVQYWNSMLYVAASGTLDCTLTYSGTGTLASDGGDEVTSDVLIPSGSQYSNEYTWTATEAGTVTVSVTDLQVFDAYNGEWTAVPNSYFMMGWVTLYVNEVQQSSDTCTLEVAANETVTVSLYSYRGDQYAANIVCDLEPAQGEEDSSDAPDTDVIIPEGSQSSNAYTWTADKTGTLTIGVSTLYQYVITDYETGAGAWEEASTMAFMMGGVDYVVNTEIVSYSPTVTMDVTAGDVVTVGLHSYRGNLFAANLTFNVEEATEGGDGEDENLNTAFSGSGTMDDPYIIESLPVDLAYTLNDEAYDIYFAYTADEAGTISCTASDTEYMWVVDGEYENGAEIEVAAGQTVLLNVWETSPSNLGNKTTSLTFEVASEDEDIGTNDCDVELPGEIVTSGKEYLESNDVTKEYYKLTWTAPADGKLYVHMCAANPGWAYGVEGLTIQHSGTAQTTDTYDVVGGTTYEIIVKAYDKVSYSDGDGEVAWTISFESGEIEIPVTDWEISGSLELGENTASMMEYTNNTLFVFEPTEIGVYTITSTVPMLDWHSDVNPYTYEGQETVTTIEWTCKEVGQSVVLGVTEDAVITVEKTGDYTPEKPIDWIYYENVNEPETPEIVLGEGEEIIYVDVTEPHTVVLGEDGYYHLSSEDGPILYVDLIKDGANMYDAYYSAYGAMTLRGVYTDAEGNVYHYDFISSLREYVDAANEEGLVPMTEDLIIFLQAYGGSNKWYDPSYSPYDTIKEGNADETAAWLVACCYVGDPNVEIEAPAGGEESKPGDTALAAIIGLMAVSAMGITVIVSKKKEF